MVIEDIKYQLEQFCSFDNIRLSFEILDKQGFIYFTNGKITSAVLGSVRDIDVFKELKDVDAHVNIQVSIGEYAPEDTLNKSFDEILGILYDQNDDKLAAGLNKEDSVIENNDAENSPVLVAKIAEGLANITGVESVLAVSPEGELLYSKGVGDDAEFESADTIFLYNQSKELGDILNFEALRSTICEANNYKKVIINDKNILYSIKLSSGTQPLKARTEAVKLLQDI